MRARAPRDFSAKEPTGTATRTTARMRGFLGILGLLVVLGIVALVLVGGGVTAGEAPSGDQKVATAEGEGFSAGADDAEAVADVQDAAQGAPGVDEWVSQLTSLTANAARTDCYEVAEPLDEAARQVVEARQAQGAALMRGGYLDILGNLWSCITWTADEVTLTFIKDVSVGDEARCRVTHVQFERERWEELCDS